MELNILCFENEGGAVGVGRQEVDGARKGIYTIELAE
jgi:hypothetical protein